MDTQAKDSDLVYANMDFQWSWLLDLNGGYLIVKACVKVCVYRSRAGLAEQ